MDSTLHAFTNQPLLAFLVSKFSRGEDLVVLETVAKEFQHCARESVYRQHAQPRSHVVIYLPQLPNDIEPITGALSVATKHFASFIFDLTQQLLDSCLAINQPITALHIIVTIDPVYDGIACHRSNPTSNAASSYQYSFRRSECTERLLQILNVDRWSELVGNICRYNSLKELSVFDATASCIERDNKPFTHFLQLDKLILNYLTDSLESMSVPCSAYTDALLNFMNTKVVGTDAPKIHTLNLSQCKSRGMCLLPERSLGMLFANASTQQYAFKSVRRLVCTGSFDDADVLHMVRQSSMWRERLHSLFPNVESVSMEVLYPGSVGFDADDISDSDDDDDDGNDDAHGKQSSSEFFRSVHFEFQTIFIDCSVLSAAHINYMLSCFGQYCNRQIVLGLQNHGLTTKRINANNDENKRAAATAADFETQLHNTLCITPRHRRRQQQQQQHFSRNKAELLQLTAVYRQTRKLVSLYYQPRGCFIRSSENSRPTSWTCTKASIDITLLKPDIEVLTETLRERFDGLTGACEQQQQQQQHVLQPACSLQINTLHYVAEWSDSLPQTQWFASLAQTSYATKIVQNSFWAMAQALAATRAPSGSSVKSPSMPNVLHRLQRLVIRIRFRYGSQPNADKVFGEGFVDAELVKTIARLTLTWRWLLDVRFCIEEEQRPNMSNWARSMLVVDEQQQNSRQCEAGGSTKQLRLSPLVKALRALQVHGDGTDGNFLCSAADDESFVSAVERNMAWLRTLCKRCDNKKHSTFL